MIRERWWVDDYEFTQGDIRDVELRDGLLSSPPLRGANVVVPNRTGQLWRPKKYDQGTFTVSLWFGNNQSQAQAQFDNILRAASIGHRLCTWSRITPVGERRYCYGEVVGSLKPTAVGQDAYRATIEVQVPGGLWRGDTLYTAVTPPPAADATSVEVDLVDLAQSTAPLEELVLRLDGYAKNPKIVDLTPRGRGESVQYATTIAKGQSLTLGCADWSATGAGGLTVNPAAINYVGDRFLVVAPDPTGAAPRLQLTADELGPDARLTVSGYRSYLV